jgi:hypothetical protein
VRTTEALRGRGILFSDTSHRAGSGRTKLGNSAKLAAISCSTSVGLNLRSIVSCQRDVIKFHSEVLTIRASLSLFESWEYGSSNKNSIRVEVIGCARGASNGDRVTGNRLEDRHYCNVSWGMCLLEGMIDFVNHRLTHDSLVGWDRGPNLDVEATGVVPTRRALGGAN